ncbi:unnamed protein product [Heligmosomoides polygyrus]|uniref:Uncharacterized protein n=1 Tax=Heligmosomoides polygyrus TaxID=6339 RepID=A0A3P7X5H6_HELPZ|nr:unnamed protein product [Heligmosomoides polygyrus]
MNTSPDVPGDSVDVPITSATVPGDAVDVPYTSATGLTGLHRMTPNELKVEAKAIVSQNSRTPPPENKARDPFAFGPRRRSSSNRTVCYDQPDPKASKESNDQNVHKSSVHESAPNEVETSQPTLCSEYSLPQIPDATAETPAAKSPEYFAGKSIPQSIDRAMHLGGAYIDDTRGSSITSPSVSEFTKFYSTPRATSVEAESPRIPDALEGDNPQSGGVPSLYTQQEYRSESQDMNGSTPARTVDNFDVPPWPSSAQFHYNDLTQTSLPTINNDFGQSLLSDGDQLLQDYIDTPWWENGANDPLSDLLYDTTTDYFNDFLS